MDAERAAAGLGLAACAAVLALAGAPYLVADAGAVGVYYAVGFAGPPLVALFCLLAAIVLLAGVRRRFDPPMAAGVALVLGIFSALLAVGWALSVLPSVVGGLTSVAALRHHRWLFAAAALVVPAASAWYARAVV